MGLDAGIEALRQPTREFGCESAGGGGAEANTLPIPLLPRAGRSLAPSAGGLLKLGMLGLSGTHRRRTLGTALTILLVFLVLCVLAAGALLPQPDEAVYANPAFNLNYNGHLGTTLYELRGYMPASLGQRTYWQFPAYFVVAAGWFRLVGFGLAQVRLLSTLFGILGLVSWYLVVRRLTGQPRSGVLAMGLIAADYFFLSGSAQGRMDLMCAGLGAAALGSYLELRERNLARALFVSHVFATLSIATHAIGGLYWLGIVYLFLTRDRERISWRNVLAAAAPCLLGMVVWGSYIAKDPAAFLDQMKANLQITDRTFIEPGRSPIPLIRKLQVEIDDRYAGPFGLGSKSSLASRPKAVVLFAYLVSLAMIALSAAVRRKTGGFALVALALISFLYLAFVSPSK